MKITISPEAKHDILSIAHFIAEESGSTEIGEKILAKLITKIDSLKTFPRAGTPLSKRLDIPSKYHFATSGHHLVFYLIDEKEIRIVRVLDSRRDWLRILFA